MKINKQKIKEILEAYSIMMNPDTMQSEIAAERLQVCDICEYNVKKLGLAKCSLCSCIIRGKVFSARNSCPANKWKR